MVSDCDVRSLNSLKSVDSSCDSPDSSHFSEPHPEPSDWKPPRRFSDPPEHAGPTLLKVKSAHQVCMGRLQGLATNVSTLEAEILSLRQERDELKMREAETLQLAATFEVQATDLNRELDRVNDENTQLKIMEAALLADNQEMRKQQERDVLRVETAEARADAAEDENKELRRLIAQLQGQLQGQVQCAPEQQRPRLVQIQLGAVRRGGA